MLIEEMLQPIEVDRLLRDSFANYVIQIALDYANPAMETRLVDAIRPYPPAIFTTPYEQRIQSIIQGTNVAVVQQAAHRLQMKFPAIRHARVSSSAAAASGT